MHTTKTKLRGSKPRFDGPWPIGSIPDQCILTIGEQLVHRMAVGHADITGDDFATIFAKAVDGEHRQSPLGIADVTLDGTAWSVKTIKKPKPFSSESLRIISGRNSPDYSEGIKNPHDDLGVTGRAVLSIWNARVNEAQGEYEDLRIAVFVRNLETREFLIFEDIAQRYSTEDYLWDKNHAGNLIGIDKVTKEHKFTWQPHGSQFTVIRKVPGSAIKFHINKNPPIIEMQHILRLARFNNNWITIIS